MLSNPKTTAEREKDIFKPLTSKVKAFLQWMCRLFYIFLISFSCITVEISRSNISSDCIQETSTLVIKSLYLLHSELDTSFFLDQKMEVVKERDIRLLAHPCSELHMFGADDSADEDLVLTSKPVTI